MPDPFLPLPDRIPSGHAAYQLEGTVAALNLHLDDQTLTRLDEIFPGYRTAPEDYAW